MGDEDRRKSSLARLAPLDVLAGGRLSKPLLAAGFRDGGG